MKLTKIDQIVQEYDNQPSWLVMILQDIHQASGSLPAAALRRVAERLSLDPGQVEDVAAFYLKYGMDQLTRALASFSIDEEICKGCGLCRRKCPVEAVTGVQKGRHEIHQDKCLVCGLCRDKCRLGSIMTNWHIEREFVRCEECGEPLGTKEELERIRDLLSANPNMTPFCPDCQRAKMASRLAEAAAMLPTDGRTEAESAPKEMC